MTHNLSKEQIQQEILELKLKSNSTKEDKKRIQKLQQLLDKIK
jgi:hypothetical protein